MGALCAIRVEGDTGPAGVVLLRVHVDGPDGRPIIDAEDQTVREAAILIWMVLGQVHADAEASIVAADEDPAGRGRLFRDLGGEGRESGECA